MNFKSALPLFAIILLFSDVSPAAVHSSLVVQFQPEGSVSFIAVGRPSAIKVRGEGAPPRGEIKIDRSQIQGHIEFDLTTLKTGIELRDSHMKEKHLQVDKFPTAKLTIEEIGSREELLKNTEFSGAQIPFKGRLQLHGIEKPIDGTININRKSSVASGEAQFVIRIPDYDLGVPKYAGITVAEDVQVAVKFSVGVTDTPSAGAPKEIKAKESIKK